MSQFKLKPRGYEQTAIIESRGAVIAEVYTDREPGDQHDIARLFAAAPDLLAVLKAMNTRGDWTGMEWAVPAEVWRAARAAISKATGA